ncbi:unnamed protein product [Auanema sp. JU1783]|nr:unnamed protein product [Auanema sp. JU1783]
MSTSASLSVHEGVSCDGCMRGNFTGNRYKCLRCYDFDLCFLCYTRNQFNEPGGSQVNVTHHEEHPMQLILSQRDFEICYEGDPSKNFDICKIVSFTCPCCGNDGHSVRTLISHILQCHLGPHPEIPMLCPICIAYPEFDSTRTVQDMRSHMSTMHGNFVDANYRSPVEPSMRNVRRPTLARRTQRAPPPPAANIATLAMGWTTDLTDVDEMFRMVARVPTMQTIANSFTIGGPVAAPVPPAQLQRMGQLIEQQHDQIQRRLRQQENTLLAPQTTQNPTQVQTQPLVQTETTARANAGQGILSLSLNSNGARSNSSAVHLANEYAQPRQSSATQRTQLSSLSVSRVLGLHPIYPRRVHETSSSSNSADEFEPYDDLIEVDANGDPVGSPRLDDISTEEESPRLEDKLPSTVGDMSKLLEGGVEPEDDKGDETTGGDFELEEGDKEENDASTARSFFTDGTFSWNPEVTITAEDIEKAMRSTLTADELESIEEALREETVADQDEPPVDVTKNRKTTDPLTSQHWMTLQFEVPPLSNFGSGGYWHDKRFLRHRKTFKDINDKSSYEDSIERTEIALALMRTTLGPLNGLSDGKMYSKPDDSMRSILENKPYPLLTGLQTHLIPFARNRKEDAFGNASQRIGSNRAFSSLPFINEALSQLELAEGDRASGEEEDPDANERTDGQDSTNALRNDMDDDIDDDEESSRQDEDDFPTL